jgi:YggT family protein
MLHCGHYIREQEIIARMFLETFVVLLLRILEFAVLIRVVLSWISPMRRYGNPIIDVVWQITEPILAPIRRFATFGMIDFSPIVALILLQVVEQFAFQFFRGLR